MKARGASQHRCGGSAGANAVAAAMDTSLPKAGFRAGGARGVVVWRSCLALVAPLIAPQNPYDLTRLDMLIARSARPSGAGGYLHWLGTDAQGRDLRRPFSTACASIDRSASACRLSSPSLSATRAASLPPIRRRIEALIMRIVDLGFRFRRCSRADCAGAARVRAREGRARAGARRNRPISPARSPPRRNRALQGVRRGEHCFALGPSPRALPPHSAELPAATDRGRHRAGSRSDRARGDTVIHRRRHAGDRALARQADRQWLSTCCRAILDRVFPGVALLIGSSASIWSATSCATC